MIVNDDCKYDEFFKVLKKALDDKKDVRRADSHMLLLCGFVVDGKNEYLMRMKELKYAKDNGVDVSLYTNLQD